MGVVSPKMGVASKKIRTYHYTRTPLLQILDPPLIDTLYHTVQKVFAPVLLKDAQWSKNMDPKIQHLLTELEAGLGSTLRRHGKVGVTQERSSRGSCSGSPHSGILTPSNEFQYWAEESISSSKLSSHEHAQFFQESFQPIVTEFANLDALSFTDVLELVEVSQDTLDDLWKQSDHSPPYPENRMRHLLEIISSSFGRYVQRKLADLDVWRGQFAQVRSCLQDGLNICEK
jgi:dynein heavy chain 2